MKECSVAQTVVLRRGIVGATQSGAIYQFKVALIGITPPIWRRVQVTGNYTLAQLHRVLQVVMGWENYHLYMFRMGSKKYGPPDPDGVDDLGMVDAKRIRLAAVMPRVGTTFTYVYDYGDDWEHELLLEATLMPKPAVTYPRCLADERRCPPEDAGGIGGYADYLEAMFDPNHAEHEERMMWRGPFDAEEFSVEKVNPIDILQCHAQNPVSASNRTPIADALTRARQQRQNRFIAIGTGAVDQLLNRCWLQ